MDCGGTQVRKTLSSMPTVAGIRLDAGAKYDTRCTVSFLCDAGCGVSSEFGTGCGVCSVCGSKGCVSSVCGVKSSVWCTVWSQF
jgi:hypothetical protein